MTNMNIKIDCTFHPDGNYMLKNPEAYGCTARNVNSGGKTSIIYECSAVFEDEKIWKCKRDARIFLEKLICEGIRVSYTHWWLLKWFSDATGELIKFIDDSNSGTYCKEIGDETDETKISVTFTD